MNLEAIRKDDQAARADAVRGVVGGWVYGVRMIDPDMTKLHPDGSVTGTVDVIIPAKVYEEFLKRKENA